MDIELTALGNYGDVIEVPHNNHTAEARVKATRHADPIFCEISVTFKQSKIRVHE
jgi:hypothetical protein